MALIGQWVEDPNGNLVLTWHEVEDEKGDVDYDHEL